MLRMIREPCLSCRLAVFTGCVLKVCKVCLLGPWSGPSAVLQEAETWASVSYHGFTSRVYGLPNHGPSMLPGEPDFGNTEVEFVQSIHLRCFPNLSLVLGNPGRPRSERGTVQILVWFCSAFQPQASRMFSTRPLEALSPEARRF